MTLRKEIEEKIQLSCTSQLFLLEGDAQQALDDIKILSNQICQLVKERLEKDDHPDHIAEIITELSGESE